MSEHDRLVQLVSGLAGIIESYADQRGEPVAISHDARRAILAGLGLAVETEADARETLSRLQALREGPLPRLIPVEAGRAPRIALRLGGMEEVLWRLTDEAGAIREGRARLRPATAGATLDLPVLRPGYYGLHLAADRMEADATIIAAPPRCWEPEDLRAEARLWGVTAQVYGLRSEHDLGIGDYGDVGRAAEGAGALGASFLGLSPVHALFTSDRTKISPYSPSSRLFLETLFIDPAAVEGFEGSDAPRLLAAPETRQTISALHDAPLVDHAAAWDVKRPVIDALWARFRSHGRQAAFEAFRREGGEPLEAHATFEALSEHFRSEGRTWLGDWPDAFRDAASEEVRRFRAENPERVAFHAWLQWLADTQLGAAAAKAEAAGMSIGLYRDLAVGADRGGSELWAAPDRFAAGLSVGAPPDPLGPQGQNWGLPPFDPFALEIQGLAAFRALVTANMRHAGAIRIDHAFQLQRLYLIPEGAPAAHGAYVAYPFEAMLAVLCLESHRHRCLVIAEDLGTAPEGFSDAIMASGVLSYRLLSFERESDGGFKPPGTYPRDALAAITTHDLPTFAGWWRGLDIELRQTLGLYDAETAERERSNRVGERARLAQALGDAELLPPGEVPDEPPLEAVMRFLARTPSALVALQLEDATGERNQVNLPGPDVGHPNWRRRLSIDVETLTAPGGSLAKLAAALAAEGRGVRASAGPLAAPPPRATYRLQFHKGFTFDDAVAIVPYLARLGISHVYSSPIHTARPGSTHGYDIVDHAAINPELGGEDGFLRLSDALREHGLGLVLDIVPNHMGIGGSDNAWWLSVLEWGELSPHGKAFDVDWERLGAHGRLVVPFLGERYGDALENGHLKLAFDPAEGSLSVWHWEHRLPISPLSYPIVLDRALAALGDIKEQAEVLAVSARLRAMDEETAPERRAGFPEEAETLKRRLAVAVAGSPALADAMGRAVALVNGAPSIPESFDTLHRILETQAYRPAHWRVAASDINYRRFFDINALAGLRVEEPEVFEQAHATVFRLVREGRIQGLRIDHIDGLADPEGYARALQAAVGPGFYVVVEKILEPGEELRPWPVAGTSGYEVLNLIDGVFVDTQQGGRFEEIYRAISDLEGGYGTLLRQAKTEVLEMSFASELEVLVSDLKRIADADRRTRDFAVNAMRRALAEIIARFPVYRTYMRDAADDGQPSPEDRDLVESTVEGAKRKSQLPDRSVHDFIASALLGGIETEGPGRPDPELVRRFRRRFQQLTGPVMAKSLEDTLFYRYARLISLNEVGGDPGHFGGTPEAFHTANAARGQAWPHNMIATATHDTKRGEDARARLNALSEMPDVWEEAVEAWERSVAPHLTDIDGAAAPDVNDRYILLQALLGAWPMEHLAGGAADLESFRERMDGFMTKALREAKRHSSWVNTNEAYEEAASGLLRAVLTPGSEVPEVIRPLAQRLAHLGMLSGLARTVLKCTLPGVPDTYQGTEFWDLSLVDPDNRRPVDYAARIAGLAAEAPLDTLLSNWRDGRIKQQVLARLLADRAAAPTLYAEAGYQPLDAQGDKAGHVLSFLRSRGGETLVVIVPRLLAAVMPEGAMPLGPEVWGDTSVPVPPGSWQDVLTGRNVEIGDRGATIGELLVTLPISVLRTVQTRMVA